MYFFYTSGLPTSLPNAPNDPKSKTRTLVHKTRSTVRVTIVAAARRVSRSFCRKVAAPSDATTRLLQQAADAINALLISARPLGFLSVKLVFKFRLVYSISALACPS